MLSQFSDYIYTLFRIIIGFLFACHGAQKLFGVLGGKAELHSALFMVAGIIEFGGGVLVALGFFASAAAFFASARGSGMYSVDHILLGKQHVRSIRMDE